MKILITGATGFLGSQIGETLHRLGHALVVLSRDPHSAQKKLSWPCEIFSWTAEEKVPEEALSGIDAVLNLSGESVGEGRWTERKRNRIFESRVIGTRYLVSSCLERPKESRPKIFINASAIGYYGDRGGEVLTEESSSGQGFLCDVAKSWEQVAWFRRNEFDRVALIRMGMVLGRTEGALQRVLPIFRFGFGGTLGGGEQWMSWIHEKDLVRLWQFVLENDIHGAVNAVSPHPVTNREFTKTLGRCLKRPTLFPVPDFALKFLLGKKSELVLASQRVLPKKVFQAGFLFSYPSLEQALRDFI